MEYPAEIVSTIYSHPKSLDYIRDAILDRRHLALAQRCSVLCRLSEARRYVSNHLFMNENEREKYN